MLLSSVQLGNVACVRGVWRGGGGCGALRRSADVVSAAAPFAPSFEASKQRLHRPAGYCHDAIDNARYLANHDVCMSAIGVQDDPETPDVNEAAGATTDIGCEHRNVVSCP